MTLFSMGTNPFFLYCLKIKNNSYHQRVFITHGKVQEVTNRELFCQKILQAVFKQKLDYKLCNSAVNFFFITIFLFTAEVAEVSQRSDKEVLRFDDGFFLCRSASMLSVFLCG